jgi:hypothetical protein
LSDGGGGGSGSFRRSGSGSYAGAGTATFVDSFLWLSVLAHFSISFAIFFATVT